MSSQGDYRQAPVFLLTLVDIVMGGGGSLDWHHCSRRCLVL
jgi:hypothetical protein